MQKEQGFPNRYWPAKPVSVALIGMFLGLAIVAVTVNRSAGQGRVKTSYLLGLDLGPEWQTTLHLTNLEDQQIKIAATAYDRYGALLGRLSAERRLEQRATQSLQRELPPLTGTIKIESPGDHLVAATLQSLDGKKLEVIPAIRQTSKHLVFPLLYPGDHSFKKLTLLNVESGMANLEIVALAKDGAELQRTFFPMLSFMASETLDIGRLFSSETLEQLAAIRVLSDKELVGVQTVDPPGGDLVGLPALSTSGEEWQFPILATLADRELWTSVGLFNPAETPASVTVEAFDAANASLGVIDRTTVAPLATHLLLTASEMPSQVAFLKMTADQPVRAWEVIGVKGGMGVAAAIGIAAEDSTLLGFELIGSVDGASLAFSPLARMAGRGVKSGVGELGATKLYRAYMSPASWQIRWLAMPLQPPGTNPQEKCTVEVKKVQPALDKPLEGVPGEQIQLSFDLEVMIPAGHTVSFLVFKSFLDKDLISQNLPRTAYAFNPVSVNGPFTGPKKLQFSLTVPATVVIEGVEGEPTVGKTLKIILGWRCDKGFDEVSTGTLATFSLKVKKKEKE
jgi:hypothetical protein